MFKMRFLVTIALAALSGCLAFEEHEGRSHHDHHSHHMRRFSHGPHGHHDHGSHNHIHSHHHKVSYEHDKHSDWYDSSESNESDFETDERPDYENSFESDEEVQPDFRRHHCKGRRCQLRTTRKPFQRKTTTAKTTRKRPTKSSTTAKPRRTTKNVLCTTISSTEEPLDTKSPSSTAEPYTNNRDTTKPFTTVSFVPNESTSTSPDTTAELSTKETAFTSAQLNKSTSDMVSSTEGQTKLTLAASSPGSNPVDTTVPNVTPNCMENCQTSLEYSPVCGTNGETYDNIGKLYCAKSCGVNVDLRHTSPCSPPTPDPNENDPSPTSTTTQPTTTTSSRTVRATDLTDFQKCMKQCAVTADYSPVCGTDRKTYINIERMNCARRCGLDVQVLCSKTCPACNVVRPPTETTVSTTSGNVRRSTQPTAIVEECMRACPISAEYNPVCGTNGVTYANPGFLLCAQSCGVDVRVVQFAECNRVTTQPSATTAAGNQEVTLSPEIDSCLRQCQVTTDYNPVCGTNGITYENPSRLDCSKFCGINVDYRASTPCFLIPPQPDSTTPTSSDKTPTTTTRANEDVTLSPETASCLRQCQVTTEYNPVCGTNGITYENPSRLECAKFCGINVDYRATTPCFLIPPQPDSTTPTSSDKTPTTTTRANEDVTLLPPEIASCLRQCQVTTEYNPVCGTNGITYENPGRLDCAKSCGVNVNLRATTPCFLVIPETDLTTSSSSNHRSKHMDLNKEPEFKAPQDTDTSSGSTASTMTQAAVTSPTPTSELQSTHPSSTENASSSSEQPPATIPSYLLSSVFTMDPNSSSPSPTIATTDFEGDGELDARFGKPGEEQKAPQK